MKYLFKTLICLMCLGCSNNHSKESLLDECSCPHASIYLQPYEDFTKKEAQKLLPKLEQEFGNWLYGEWKFEILDPIPLPQESKSDNRYMASIILKHQEKQPLEKNEFIIGLTHKDICANVHNIKNYGIIGLSHCPGKVCVVSDKRLKNKSLYWKPILHEFIHTFYGAKHCKNNDPTCYMVDAKGHGNFTVQNKLCDSCRK